MAQAENTRDETPDVVDRAHRNFKDSRDHSSEWRNLAGESGGWYSLVSGEQWDAGDIQRLQDQQRPAVTFNRILRTINAITGTQVSNRQETRYIPREQGDVQVNEILSAAGDWARDLCDAEDEESDAFRDMCTCGMGWTETRMDYDNDPEGEIRIERVDPLEMYWDPGAKKKNLGDAKWFMHIQMMEEDDFAARWPDVDLDTAAAPWDGAEDDVSARHHVYPQDAYKIDQGKRRGPKGKRIIRVGHMQYSVREDSYRVGKKALKVSADKFERLRDRLDEQNIKHIRQSQVTWRRAFVAGGAKLEDGPSPYPDGPTFRPMTYERDRNNNTWFGVVKAMADPQKFGNKFFSQILDILNKGSKGGIIAETTAFDDPREAEAKWARPDAIVWARDGALAQNKIEPKPIVQLPPGMDNLMTFSLDAVHEVTGINLELLGFANRQQAGVLENTRKQAGLTIIAPLFDAMRRYRKEQGRVMLHFIQKYISDGRLIRVLGKNGQEQYIPLMRQDDTATYDVIVDEAPTSPNMKERVYGALVEMLPSLSKMGIPLPPELLDYAPIPSSLAQKWKEQIEQGQQIPPELQKQMQKLQEDNAKLKDKKDETFANLQLKGQEGQMQLQIKRQEKQMEMDLKQADAEAELDLEQQKLQIASEKTAAELQMQRFKIEQELALARQKLEGELMVKSMTAQAAGAASNGDDSKGFTVERMREVFEQDVDKLRGIFKPDPVARRIRVNRNTDGLIDTADLQDEFDGHDPKTRRIVINRDEDGLIESADIENMEPQGNA